jgi:hypothetical protein
VRRRTLDAARGELNHLAPFTMAWREYRRGRAVERIEIEFTPKDPRSRADAEAELERSRVGRKARRQGSAEVVSGVSSAVAAALGWLRRPLRRARAP